MTEKFNLADLITASSKGSVLPAKQIRGQRQTIRARLIAQEYIRNGMNLGAAYTQVTKMKAGNKSLDQMTGGHTDEFVDEIRTMVDGARIDQQAVLNNLWTLIESSIFDFFDDDGNVLSIKEIKRMPRVYQQLIEQIEVKSAQHQVFDEKGKPLLDDNGNPYLRSVQDVKIKLPPKLLAVDLLAKIMKWIGPNVVINNNNTNVAVFMTEKDQQRRRMETHYARVLENTPLPSPAGSTEPSGT